MFKYFETFNELNIKIWKGQSLRVPFQFSNTFGNQNLAARSQILTQTGRRHLHFTSTTRQKVGIMLDNTIPLKQDMARKVLKFVTRTSPVSLLASFHALQCTICTTDFENHVELSSHFTECAGRFEIRASGLEEQLSYTCERCDTTAMNYTNMVAHIFTFCIINFRATCPYCNSVNKICQCAKNKLDEANMLDIIRSSLSSYDLLYDKNLFFLIAWLESTRLSQPAQGSDFDHSSLKDFDFNMKLQLENN